MGPTVLGVIAAAFGCNHCLGIWKTTCCASVVGPDPRNPAGVSDSLRDISAHSVLLWVPNQRTQIDRLDRCSLQSRCCRHFNMIHLEA